MNQLDVAKTFYILDFDRCLGNTNALFDEFERAVVKHTGLTAWSLRNVRHEVEAAGDSFDTATYVRAQLEFDHLETIWNDLVESFVRTCSQKDMLNPGARELIAWLRDQKMPYGTVTYGEMIWQELKIRAAGLEEMRCLVTSTKRKGMLFREWQTNDGVFELPAELGSGRYASIVLVDDRALSFDSFPELPSCGYWVCDPQHELSSQEGSVPDNVIRFDNLTQVLEELKSKTNIILT